MGSIILENFDPDKENQPVHREIKSLLIMVLFLFEAGLALPPSPLPKNPSSCSSGILVHFYPNTPFKWPVFLKQNKDALIVNIFKSNKLSNDHIQECTSKMQKISKKMHAKEMVTLT